MSDVMFFHDSRCLSVKVSRVDQNHPCITLHTLTQMRIYTCMRKRAWQKSDLDAHVPGLSHSLLHDADGRLAGVQPTTNLAPSWHGVGLDSMAAVSTLDGQRQTVHRRAHGLLVEVFWLRERILLESGREHVARNHNVRIPVITTARQQ